MDVLLQNLQSEWEGDASKAFDARYNELRPGFVAAKDLIDEIARALDDIANSTEELDSTIASQF